MKGVAAEAATGWIESTRANESVLLACPCCREAIAPEVKCCTGCGRTFSRTERSQLDFRLQLGQVVAREFAYTPLAYDRLMDVPLSPETRCPETRNRYQGPIPHHLTADQISYIPQARIGDRALDLGCGSGIHRQVLEGLGYCYLGVDYVGGAADHLIDAHAMPYGDEQFALILSVAVLEHLAQPLFALQEVFRVLRPEGYFVGTVAFLEPFHDNSFFHFTHVGLWHALRTAGLAVETIMPIRGWHVARAQVEMGFGARWPRWFTWLLTKPFAAAVGWYAALGRLCGRDCARHERGAVFARHAGAFYFVARKESSRGA